MSFNGNDGINFTNGQANSFLTQLEASVCAWVNTDRITSSEDQYIFSKHTSGRHIMFHINRNTNLLGIHSHASSYNSLNSNSPIPINTWTHVAYTIDSNKLVSLYINGKIADVRVYDRALDASEITLLSQ